MIRQEWTEPSGPGVRVSIGETRCLREDTLEGGKLLVVDDLKAYAHLTCAFYRLEFSLTMLPERSGSIEHGELILELLPDNYQAKLPFLVRLYPDQEIVLEKMKLKKSHDGKATFKIPTFGEVGGDVKRESESEVQVETVAVTSWGAGEQKGGWRFNATATRSIKTSITGLTALVAIPINQTARGHLRAVAHLRPFKNRRGQFVKPKPEVFITYEFPPTVDASSAAARIPEYI